MNLKGIIGSIILEAEYRTKEGIVDFKKPSHLDILSEVMDELGLSDIKYELIANLKEAEEDTYRNNTLKKSVTYQNEKGEEVTNMVGNLLRLPKDDPGRIAAEKQLPKDTAEREKIMNDLGSQNQPNRDDSSTDDTESEDTPAGEEGMMEPETGTAFDGESGDAYRDSLPDGDPAKEEDDEVSDNTEDDSTDKEETNKE